MGVNLHLRLLPPLHLRLLLSLNLRLTLQALAVLNVRPDLKLAKSDTNTG
ncbi:hypothetical protein CCACVL1_23173 [Corchorus capsularis]|uniref:Uncharacterized protein n=1 Tax=Corchorus capsularis TaxID=210143 RepID=A0A1R3GUX3_COCAP|nr:hypothetical protein CCACVL1_23173 [Corchorus capsularis]